MKAQLPLFHPDAEAQRTLQEHYDALAAYHEVLLGEHLALQQEVRTLTQERDRWFNAFQTLKLLQMTTEEQVERRRQRQRPDPTTTTLEPLFKKLIGLCHPDKWHNQPATDLAHELSIVINALREEVEP